MNAWGLLEVVRAFLSRYPEYRDHQAWELQWLMFALGYTNRLEDEAEISSARDVALTDLDGEAA